MHVHCAGPTVPQCVLGRLQPGPGQELCGVCRCSAFQGWLQRQQVLEQRCGEARRLSWDSRCSGHCWPLHGGRLPGQVCTLPGPRGVTGYAGGEGRDLPGPPPALHLVLPLLPLGGKAAQNPVDTTILDPHPRTQSQTDLFSL